MKPLACNYYITARCNAACEFCSHWREEEPLKEEAGTEVILRNLRGLKLLGVHYLDITGGEPLLRDDLPEILAYAKKLKLFTVLTTNCALFPAKGEKIAQHCDRLLFSLDFPDAEQHNRSRDAELFANVLESIKIAKQVGRRPIINYTLTRDSVRFLPEMEDLARRYGVLVWLNPVYASPAHEGLTPDSLAYVAYFLKKKSFAGNAAALRLLKHWGNNPAWPVCQAARSVITITADSYVVAPCYYFPAVKIKIDRNLKDIFNSPEYWRARPTQGKDSVCSGCLNWGYMLPSFWFRLDRYFFLNLYSGMQLLMKEFLANR
ncbi:MAG: radical SAM protein [Candidatus Margulisiibacteriota bacterium]